MSKLQKFQHELHILSNPKLNRNVCVAIIKHSEPGLIKAICEIVLNLCRGTVNLSPAQKQGLKKEKTTLRRLLDSRIGLKTKRKILAGKGGKFFPLLIQPVKHFVLNNNG